jgi:hypothetical protein
MCLGDVVALATVFIELAVVVRNFAVALDSLGPGYVCRPLELRHCGFSHTPAEVAFRPAGFGCEDVTNQHCTRFSR